MHNFSFQIFCLTVPKNFFREHFGVSEKGEGVSSKSGSEKFYASEKGEGVSRFYIEHFSSHSAENFRRGEYFSVSSISGIEKVWIREGGISRFSVENFLSHGAECFRRGILYCCINSGYRKSLDKRGVGGVSGFSVEKFLSHSAESFNRGTLS